MTHFPVYKKNSTLRRHTTNGIIDINLSSIPDPKMSSVRRMHFKQNYTVGECFKVKVILRDKYGRRLQNDGDVLRIWLVNYNLKANVIGSTTYIGNGTYVGKLLLPWKGNGTVFVSIAQTRQAITSVMSAINKYGNLYEMYGLFSNEIDRYHGQTDKTLCSTVSIPRMGADVCNLTSQNFGYSWFCAKPKSLRCEDWKAVSGRIKTFLPQYIVTKTRNQFMVLRNTVKIQIGGETEIMSRSVMSCHDLPKASTWTEAVPTGFYYKRKWNFVNCRSRLKRTEWSYLQCLKGRHLLIIGDSNTRNFVAYLRVILKLSFYPNEVPLGPYVHFVFGHNRPYNVSMSWFPHEHPFFNSQYLTIKSMQSVANRLNNVGSHNNSIILIHIWAHFVRIPPFVFRQHIRGISNSARSLLRRSPEVSIYIKGPHAILDRESVAPSDYLQRVHKQIWFEEFQHLQEKVTFLNMWDITGGTENQYIHPDDDLVTDMVHNFMSYACPS
ncbi:NXPE family member 4-like [Mizuhopecten yessoensis]|uniref:NXPE family member 4-like n=1 Tax=Mizuhopecten yessoensis TaxID=6573 RepID=UPI000B45EE3F|nr:NXPE family member 4-like [Mizuhopecten yessoensis]